MPTNLDTIDCPAVVNLRDIPRDQRGVATLRRNGIERVDRATRWGNPFHVGRHRTRQQAVAKYRTYLWNEIREGNIAVSELAELAKAEALACWCCLPSNVCHARVLARAAGWAARQVSFPAATDPTPPADVEDETVCPDPDFRDPRANPWTGEQPEWHKGGFEW